jgi:hypothetical protein
VNKSLLSCILLSFNFVSLHPNSKYPVDISYLVTDFKYSKKDGLKICEVQHGSLSVFHGDLHVHGQDGAISPKIAQYFSKFPSIKKWATNVVYKPLKNSLPADEWDFKNSLKNIIECPEFLELAQTPPADPYTIDSYNGMVYADSAASNLIDLLRNAYPGIIFIDAATFPYWIDKYKMSQLFDTHDDLKQYKADWRVYDKKYDSYLSEKIQQDMPSDLYVIKPRKEFLANGVIVVASQDLDATLQLILEPLDTLKDHPDKTYAYWHKNTDENFIIEKYYESDYLTFSQPLNNDSAQQGQYHYDTTMRLVIILEYNNGEITYHNLGGFCKLPYKALEEEGTLDEKRISYGKVPFYTAIEPELLEEIDMHMEKAMLLLYETMLNQEIE